MMSTLGWKCAGSLELPAPEHQGSFGMEMQGRWLPKSSAPGRQISTLQDQASQRGVYLFSHAVEASAESTECLVGKMPVFPVECARGSVSKPLEPLGTYSPTQGALLFSWKPDPLGGKIPPMGPEWVVLDVWNGTLTRGATPATERFFSRFAPAVLVQR